MPRGKRPVQPAAVGPSQVYGQGQELTQSMKDIPLPDDKARMLQAASQGMPPAAASGQVSAPSAGGRASTGGGAAPFGGAAPTPAPDPWTAATVGATAMAPPPAGGMLGQALAGTLTGAAAPAQPSAFWAKVAQVTGDPAMLRLAQRARLQQ